MMSIVQPLAQVSASTEGAGSALRAARERLGWTLPEIAAGLHIRLCHLEALEAGQFAKLPAYAYAVGFVRSYARSLGLDAEEMVRRFKAEAADTGRRTELVFPVPMPDRGLPAGAVMLLGIVLSIGAYVGWYRLSGEGRLPAETVTAIPMRLAPLAEQALPPTPSAVMTADVAARVPQAVEIVDRAPAAPMISPSSAAAALVHEPVADRPPLAVAATPALDGGRIVLRATADSWVQVKDRAGTVLLNRTMKTGDTWPVPKQDNLLLTTGNAGGTDVLVDGAVTASLGGLGAVRRDLPLDPDLIKDGKLAPAASPQIAAARGRQ